MPGQRAKLFKNGRSQAVRLPKGFRFEGDEVEIRREGSAVVLEPVKRERLPGSYWQRVDRLRKGLAVPEPGPLSARLLDLDLDDERP